MSREIKFRAWVNEHWVDWLPTSKSLETYNAVIIDEDGYSTDSKCHIEQYTGLKDKNGKEIYEGDIVFCKDCNEHHEITWVDNCACFHGWRSDKAPCIFFGESYETIYYEVVGNIHENPELLEGER